MPDMAASDHGFARKSGRNGRGNRAGRKRRGARGTQQDRLI